MTTAAPVPRLIEQFEPCFEAYPDADRREAIAIDADARGPDRFVVTDDGDVWTVEQTLVDPEGHDEWYLEVTVDLPASADAGEIVAAVQGVVHRG